tara:strand:+ start:445 stop:633 length:189 start_codon:yes stop_codon:yes gene_type:complete
MTWTAIIFDGHAYTREIFYGSHDSVRAMREASGKFGRYSPTSRNVVVIIPGENPVYINEKKT